MGSIIRLALGNLEIDWGKNGVYSDHSELFQVTDVVDVERKVYDDYNNEGDEPLVATYECLSKPLRDVVARLGLLGVSDESARRDFAETICFADYNEVSEEPSPIDYEEFAELMLGVEVSSVSDRYQSDFDFGEFFTDEIAPRIGLVRDPLTLRRYGRSFENLKAHTVLWMLSRNARNLDLPVIWDYEDHVGEEWSAKEDHVRTVGRVRQFLIVTEGSSDAYIIKKALALRRPEVADFFYFVDTNSGFPFVGTGNLHNFCQGLARIGVLNQTVIVYDNDAAGRAQWRQTVALKNLPSNIRVMLLPDLPPETKFATVGPGGEVLDEVNGRAAAIEAYLDLTEYVDPPKVRWTSYVNSVEGYQGEFEGKSRLGRDFLRRTEFTGYDFSKLDIILAAIIEASQDIARDRRTDGPLR